jgi:uncharacterized protein YkwD
MLEMVALQNVVVEHKRALATAIGAELTKQVRALGLPDAKVWISFDGEGAKEPLPEIVGKSKKAKAAKAVAAGSKAEKKAFYMMNYWRKKKGLPTLSKEAWKASRNGKPVSKEEPSKN